MKDNKNKNLEDFFNSSLEQFDDGPSEQVWDGLAERLEEDVTFFQRWRDQILRWMPVLLLLMGFGAYYFFTQQKLDQLQGEVLSIQEQNTLLNKDLTLCSKQNQETQNLTQQNDEGAIESSPQPITQSTSTTSIDKKLTAKTTPTIVKHNSIGLPTTAPSRSMDQQSATSGEAAVARISKTMTATRLQKIAESNTTIFGNKILPPAKEKSAAPTITEALITTSNAWTQPLAKISRTASKVKAKYVSQRGLYNLGIVYSSPINLLEEKPESRYSIGITGRQLITTISGIGNSDKLGFSVGVLQNYKLAYGISLVNGLRFNHQNYSITNNAILNDNSVLQNYPGARALDNNLEKIHASSNYIDMNLGLKFQVFKIRKKNLYLKSGLIWQAYLPQNFTYTLKGGSSIERKENRYVGYFGSINSGIGMEGQWDSRFYYQFELWREKSIIPLGVENQDVSMLGISFSLFFGKMDSSTVLDFRKKRNKE